MEYYTISNMFSAKPSPGTIVPACLFPFYLYESRGMQQEQYYNNGYPELHPKIVSAFALTTGLLFEPVSTLQYGNLCFAGNPGIRDDYKTTFTTNDVLDYTYALLNALQGPEKPGAMEQYDITEIPYPQDAAAFRKLAYIGNSLRLQH